MFYFSYLPKAKTKCEKKGKLQRKKTVGKGRKITWQLYYNILALELIEKPMFFSREGKWKEKVGLC